MCREERGCKEFLLTFRNSCRAEKTVWKKPSDFPGREVNAQNEYLHPPSETPTHRVVERPSETLKDGQVDPNAPSSSPSIPKRPSKPARLEDPQERAPSLPPKRSASMGGSSVPPLPKRSPKVAARTQSLGDRPSQTVSQDTPFDDLPPPLPKKEAEKREVATVSAEEEIPPPVPKKTTAVPQTLAEVEIDRGELSPPLPQKQSATPAVEVITIEGPPTPGEPSAATVAAAEVSLNPYSGRILANPERLTLLSRSLYLSRVCFTQEHVEEVINKYSVLPPPPPPIPPPMTSTASRVQVRVGLLSCPIH